MSVEHVEEKFWTMKPKTYQNLVTTLGELGIFCDHGRETVYSKRLGNSSYATCSFSIGEVEYKVFDNSAYAWITSEGKEGTSISGLIREMFFSEKRVCLNCGEMFEVEKWSQKYCKKKCFSEQREEVMSAYHRKKRAEYDLMSNLKTSQKNDLYQIVPDIKEIERKLRAMRPKSYRNLLQTLSDLGIPCEFGREYLYSTRLGDTSYKMCSFSLEGVTYRVFSNPSCKWTTSTGANGHLISSLVRKIFGFSMAAWE